MGKWRGRKREFWELTVWKSGSCKGVFPQHWSRWCLEAPAPHLTLRPGSETFQKMTAVPLALAQDSGKPSAGAWASEVHANPDEEVERKLSVTLSEIRIRMLVKHCRLSLAPESMV